MKTVRLTTAQAIVRFLIAQRTEIDGREAPLFPGVFAIFGHGNVTGLGYALDEARDELPTLPGPERAGDGAGGGRLREGDAPAPDHGRHLVDRAGRAEHGDGGRGRDGEPAARCCCSRATRSRAGSPTRCCSRSSTSGRPRRRSTTPSARSRATGTGSSIPPRSPSRCRTRSRRCSTRRTAARLSSGCPRTSRRRRTTIPERLFEPRVHTLRRQRPDADELAAAAAALRAAERPLIIAGGGVHYSLAETELAALRGEPRHAGRRDRRGQVVPDRGSPAATSARSA